MPSWYKWPREEQFCSLFGSRRSKEGSFSSQQAEMSDEGTRHMVTSCIQGERYRTISVPASSEGCRRVFVDMTMFYSTCGSLVEPPIVRECSQMLREETHRTSDSMFFSGRFDQGDHYNVRSHFFNKKSTQLNKK